MPKAFEQCVKQGGRVRTKQVGEGKQMKICFAGGKSFAGHVEYKQQGKKRPAKAAH